VALTAGALVSERQRALKAGMNDIVTKPFDPQVLIRKVRYLVEQTRNEPIPIAVLDRRRGLQPAVEPLIPSIDADVVQRMFGQDLTLFTSALSRMLRDYVDFAEPISAPLGDQVVRSQLTARVHELRGSAGLMGAMGVMHLAGTAETALEQGRSIDVVGPILGRLTSAYSDMRDEAQFWLARQAEREALSDVKTAPRPTIEAADVEELYALLDSRNLAALDKFSLLSPSLSEFLGAARFDRLRDAVDNLDFPLGAQLLRASGSLIPA
jgi:HPt (histidine-containing phosphotransfer) domain-containing protein